MTCFADTLDAMIEEANHNVQRLRDLADTPLLPKGLYVTVINVLQAETLRLDMLRSVYQELGDAPVPDLPLAHWGSSYLRQA
jgi:hypothetical protein